MDERSLHEAAAPLIALARIWQQVGSASCGAASSAALPLLAQLLTLCSAQRGAVLLPRGPALAHLERRCRLAHCCRRFACWHSLG